MRIIVSSIVTVTRDSSGDITVRIAVDIAAPAAAFALRTGRPLFDTCRRLALKLFLIALAKPRCISGVLGADLLPRVRRLVDDRRKRKMLSIEYSPGPSLLVCGP